MTKILFVCTGNICRSPTAEYVLRELARRNNIQPPLHIESAGTHDYHSGDPADRRAGATARDHGFDLSGHRARSVIDRDFQEFDYIIALDHDHLSFLKRRCPPQETPHIDLLMSFAPDCPEDEVPDPYYGDRSDYEQSFDLIEAACRGLLDTLAQDHN